MFLRTSPENREDEYESPIPPSWQPTDTRGQRLVDRHRTPITFALLEPKEKETPGEAGLQA